MKIDVKKLLREGKNGISFSFSTVLDDNLIALPNTEFLGEGTITGELEIAGEDVYVDGEVSYVLKGECSRCLSPAEERVVEKINARYVRENPQEDDYVYTNGQVDLTELMHDAVVCSIPLTLYCKKDCKGLCSKCGQNLNEKECNCEK